MEELIYKPEDPAGHPNLEMEEDLKSIEMLVEMGTDVVDLKNIYFLKDKILKKKYDAEDIALFTQLKNRYLIKQVQTYRDNQSNILK